MERRFYQLSPAERLRVIARTTRLSSADEGFLDRLLKSAESLEAIWIENQVGFMTVPLGVIPRIVVNRRPHAVPLATEEPGIIAAVEYAAEHCIQSDGFTCTHLDDVIRGQIVYHGRDDFADILEAVQKWGPEIIARANERHTQICRASRGLVDITPKLLSSAAGHSYLSLDLTLVAADIMGAGAVTAYAEEIAAELAKLTGRQALLRIVSNDAGGRIVECQVGFLVDDVGGMQTAELIVAAAQYAAADERRAITHNKGIQNGLEAFALALGNDTRALSAGVHYYALRGGTCKPLSTWWLEGKILKGKATIPVALGSVGGATRRSVIRDICWRMLDCDSGTMAREICAAVGVAANLGALRALVTTGVGGKWS